MKKRQERREAGCRTIGETAGEEIIPGGDTCLHAGDVLVILKAK